ncbi:MAG: 50S ribosomal protein L11 methyltransferase [Variibacter sp.]
MDQAIGFADGFSGARSRQGVFRRAIRRSIHFFSYHLFLKRRSVRQAKAAGFQLTIRPTVFHPRVFLASEFFAAFIDRLDLVGKRVVDVGTGTGILALAAARAGAASVVAIDINPNAVEAAAENAIANGFADRVTALRSNLLSALPAEPQFDVVVSNPPFFPGAPRDDADRAWVAGRDYEHISDLFDQVRERLQPDGCMYLLLSTDADLDLLGNLSARAGFRTRLVHERSIFIEALRVYELRLVPKDVRARAPEMAQAG